MNGLNENVIAIAIVVLAISLAYFGLDDGSFIKSVVSAYLGFLTAKRIESNRQLKSWNGKERRKS